MDKCEQDSPDMTSEQIIEKVVIRYINGRIKKGTTNNFEPNRNFFKLKTLDGEKEDIDIAGIKSIFFVKDFEGEKHHSYKYKDNIPDVGKKIRVEFNDGEIILGYVLGYSPRRLGFELVPADLDGNNLRIYVVTAAIKKVQFLEPSKFKLL